MATEVRIPRLGFSVAEATVVEWLVADGASVTAGQPLYVIETEKVENEIEAPGTGTVRITAAAGESYAVGTLLAEIS